MRVMQPFDPSTLPQANSSRPTIGEGEAQDSGLTNACGTLYFLNKSNVGVNLLFDDGSYSILPPWFARVYVLKNKTSNRVEMSQAYVLQTQSNPISQLYWEAYQQGEDTTGLYNGPLPFQMSIGNNTVTIAQLLQNLSSNPALIEILQANMEVGGQPYAAQIGNNGSAFFGETGPLETRFLKWDNSGFLQIFRNSVSGDVPVLFWKDANTGKIWQLFVKQADGSLYWQEQGNGAIGLHLFPNGSISSDAGNVSTDGSGNATVKSLKANGNISLVNGAGGVFVGQTGSGLQAFSKFTGTTTGTYSHGLGITPTHVDPEQHAVGSSSFGWDSETSTQVHITNFNGAAFSAMAYNI